MASCYSSGGRHNTARYSIMHTVTVQCAFSDLFCVFLETDIALSSLSDGMCVLHITREDNKQKVQ